MVTFPRNTLLTGSTTGEGDERRLPILIIHVLAFSKSEKSYPRENHYGKKHNGGFYGMVTIVWPPKESKPLILDRT
jgi:hypothetical protein